MFNQFDGEKQQTVVTEPISPPEAKGWARVSSAEGEPYGIPVGTPALRNCEMCGYIECQCVIMAKIKAEHVAAERRAFVREAAIRLRAVIYGPTVAAECWLKAVELWDAKPEDC